MRIFKLSIFLFILNVTLCNAQDLKVYTFGTCSVGDEPSFGFVSLTDGFPFIDHPDSLVITDEYLGADTYDYDQNNFHELDSIYRKRFLDRLQIKESDQLYLYHLVLDTIYTFMIRDLSLVAYLTPYGPSLPIPEEDYFIGFAFSNTQYPLPDNSEFMADFVAIGSTCPFQTGQLKPMIWTKMKTEKFPSFHSVKNLPADLDMYEISGVYQYKQDNLCYYLCEYTAENRNSIRHLIAVDALTAELVYNHIFKQFYDAEIIPINTDETDQYTFNYQWSGKLFINKPPILFNFIDPWFGCPMIHFTNSTVAMIELKCDNRH